MVILTDSFNLINHLSGDAVVNCRRILPEELKQFLSEIFFILPESSVEFIKEYKLVDNVVDRGYKIFDDDIILVEDKFGNWWEIQVHYREGVGV